jgi:alkylation response protein AidB-like acyl-CoA dehydrogenase
MNFAFTEEQRLIRETARSFLAEQVGSARLRSAMASPEGWDRGLWQAISSELGWSGITVPEAFGGLGLGWVELAILMEESGRVLLPAPFFAGIGLALPAILSSGDALQQAALLPDIASGETIATLCLTGGNARFEADRLSGTASPVLYGESADLLVVALPGGQMAALPAQTPGISIERLVHLDPTRPACRIRFDGVAITPDQMLGAGLEETLALGAIMLAAEQTGAAERCLNMTVEYAKTRVQFGRVIGSFQAVKHRLADLMVLVESAKSAVYYAACTADEDPAGLLEAASIARIYASETFLACAGEAIQLHGGIGFTWDYDAQLYFKRARADATLLGDPAQHRERIARLIGLDEEE